MSKKTISADHPLIVGDLRGADHLSHLTGADVEDRFYDRGYWQRIAGLPRPAACFGLHPLGACAGWDDADAELKAEA